MYKALKGYKNHWKKDDVLMMAAADAEKFIKDKHLKLLTPEEEREESLKLREAHK